MLNTPKPVLIDYADGRIDDDTQARAYLLGSARREVMRRAIVTLTSIAQANPSAQAQQGTTGTPRNRVKSESSERGAQPVGATGENCGLPRRDAFPQTRTGTTRTRSTRRPVLERLP